MAEAGTAASPAQSKLTASDVSARLQQVLALLFPSNLAAKAALFAVVVVLLPTSQAPRLWELPHLLLLGIIISYGVFGRKNAEVAAVAVDYEPSVVAFVSEMMQGSFGFGHTDTDGGDDEGDGGVQAWSSQYVPDDPLVVVAGNVSNDDGKFSSEKPLHLPVRNLKPADEVPQPASPTGDAGDGLEDDDFGELLAPKKGRERGIPWPSSVLDADLTLSPSTSPPPPPPFLGSGRRLQKAKARSFNEFGTMSGRMSLLQSASNNKQQLRSKPAVHATRSSAFAGHDPPASVSYEAADDDGELDEVVAGAASDRSFSSDDDMPTDNDQEENSYAEEEEVDDGDSCDEDLYELVTRPGPEADEVDRKAEEFIAKFRDQIRMQRIEPARR